MRGHVVVHLGHGAGAVQRVQRRGYDVPRPAAAALTFSSTALAAPPTQPAAVPLAAALGAS